MHPKVWEASGHVGGFTDPMVDCKVSKQRFRADQIFLFGGGRGRQCCWLRNGARERPRPRRITGERGDVQRKKAIQGKLEPVQVREFTTATPEEIPLIPSPATGEPGSLTPPRGFNMMLETLRGRVARTPPPLRICDQKRRKECSMDFKAVLDTGRVKIPFGIAQVGKSFRNEITTAQLHLSQPGIRTDGDGILHQRRG
jgi:glycyl-tRNA synthetase